MSLQVRLGEPISAWAAFATTSRQSHLWRPQHSFSLPEPWTASRCYKHRDHNDKGWNKISLRCTCLSQMILPLG
jgi:hypothetical protein